MFFYKLMTTKKRLKQPICYGQMNIFDYFVNVNRIIVPISIILCIFATWRKSIPSQKSRSSYFDRRSWRTAQALGIGFCHRERQTNIGRP